MHIDIVIVNWNSGDFLKKCIKSVFTEKNINLINKVIVIDNASKDNSLEGLVKNDKLVFIKNEQNLGFAKACNQGFEISDAAYVLLLNPDAQLLEATLQDCYQYMEAHSSIDILGCQLLDDDNNITASCGRFPTPKSFFYRSLGLTNLFPKVFTPPELMYDWDHLESRYVDQIIGAFMFIRKNVFEKIGYFDERFFVYSEELDFSKRLANAGGKSYYNADIKAIHSCHGSTDSVKAYRLFLNNRSRLLCAKKHFSKSGYLLTLISTLFFEPVSRIFFSLIKFKFREIIDIVKAYALLFKFVLLG
ncbi:glycosyltransferase family 2 protein [Ferruginibacter albus]|uniref:glycosyltransferase family 2 protein n=1 Tax=Ferruginibacter albus TaxID=2875540 RepID=UPI001CC60CE5|nr:glycosyltransferase family 2 protein [Ferruginibacter albus]UAY52249.1 glycosyltransferase [Ferruginibacter albus]